MILLDTHVWIWWVHGDKKLPERLSRSISRNEEDGLAVSAMSCWEVTKLVRSGKLNLRMEMEVWFEQSLKAPEIAVLPVTREIALKSGRLPNFPNRDPGDEIIVATSIVHMAKLATCDRLLLEYPEVKCLQF